jgi:hypothetical protein
VQWCLVTVTPNPSLNALVFDLGVWWIIKLTLKLPVSQSALPLSLQFLGNQWWQVTTQSSMLTLLLLATTPLPLFILFCLTIVNCLMAISHQQPNLPCWHCCSLAHPYYLFHFLLLSITASWPQPTNIDISFPSLSLDSFLFFSTSSIYKHIRLTIVTIIPPSPLPSNWVSIITCGYELKEFTLSDTLHLSPVTW